MTQSERLAAICALYQGEPPNLPLLSKATGRTLRGLELAAKRGAWVKPPTQAQSNAHKVQELLLRLEALMNDNLDNGITSKSDVDEMLNLLKLTEKMSATSTLLNQHLKQDISETQERDCVVDTKTIQIVLREMDQRIQELAEHRAKELLDAMQNTQ